ncbi:hypothetical protein HMPREF9413_1438 [Paenibacillus sp. HGF7]|nr:hypothetical protein HMPREF9413_1438 [Paenibacillus sp. HGF7]
MIIPIIDSPLSSIFLQKTIKFDHERYNCDGNMNGLVNKRFWIVLATEAESLILSHVNVVALGFILIVQVNV